jgi:hypothetical protein
MAFVRHLRSCRLALPWQFGRTSLFQLAEGNLKLLAAALAHGAADQTEPPMNIAQVTGSGTAEFAANVTVPEYPFAPLLYPVTRMVF